MVVGKDVEVDEVGGFVCVLVVIGWVGCDGYGYFDFGVVV